MIETGVYEAHLQPAVRAYHNANQSIANNTVTAVALNSERFDQTAGAAAAHHDTATNNSRLTCLYAGIYQITAHAAWDSNATGLRKLFIRLNGATQITPTVTCAPWVPVST